MRKITNKGRTRIHEKDKIIIAADEELQNQREEEQLDMPRRSPRNTETLVADPRVIPSGSTLADEVRIHHEPKLSGAFKKMAERGIRFTSYEVRDGAGRSMREEEEDE